MRHLLDIKKHVVSAIFICLLFCFATSCTKEGLHPLNTEPLQGKEIELKLNILGNTNVATRSGASTRSVASAEELSIKSGYLFVFNSEGDYRDHGIITPEIIAVALGSGTKSPTLVVPLAVSVNIADTDNVVLILNQNPTPAFNNTGGNINSFTSFTKSAIDLRFSLSGTNGFVHLGGDIGLPMYGEAKGSAYETAFNVTRAVAKLQVRINMVVSSQNSWVFNEEGRVTYQIYQSAAKGNISTPKTPETLNYSTNNNQPTDTIVETEINKATSKSNIVSAAGTSYIYEFRYSTHIISDEGNPSPSIGASEYHKDRLAIILRVKHDTYDPVDGSNIEFKYYKLVLFDKTTNKYIDIKRNFNYQININSISEMELGHLTAEEALMSPPSNIEYDIISNPTGSTTVSNGAYAISIGAQPYTAGTTIWEGGPIELTNEVKILLAPGNTELPLGKNIITYTGSDAEDGTITISPTSLTTETQAITITTPYNWAGQLSYRIELGNLIYISPSVQIVSDVNALDPKNPVIRMDYAAITDARMGTRGSFTKQFTYFYDVDDSKTDVGADKWITKITKSSVGDRKKLNITYQPHLIQGTKEITVDNVVYEIIYDNGYITPELMTTLGHFNEVVGAGTGIPAGVEDRNKWGMPVSILDFQLGNSEAYKIGGFHLLRRGWQGHDRDVLVENVIKGIDPFTDDTPAGPNDALKYWQAEDVSVEPHWQGYDQSNKMKFDHGALQSIRMYGYASSGEADIISVAAYYCSQSVLNPTSNEGYTTYYLPSASEFKWIYDRARLYLGPSYTFNAANYWSATENDDTSAWFVDFTDGDVNYIGGGKGKSISHRVRCIRDL